jgi:acyl-CoA thioester hydrolase
MIGEVPATIRNGRHLYRVRVYYEDTDAGGVVYHANYLRLAERARTEALRDLSVPHAEMTRLFGLIFMVRRVNLDYLAPARLDDSLVVVTQPLAIRAASVELRQSFHLDCGGTPDESRPLAIAQLQLACVRLADLRPGRVPERWRAALATLAGAAPASGGIIEAGHEPGRAG